MTTQPSNSAIRQGVICALAAAFIFSALYAIAKTLSLQYHIMQAVTFRYLLALIVALVYSHKYERKSDLKLEKKVVLQHAFRGAVGMIAATLLFYAFTLMPLGDAISLNFSSSLFLCLLSWPMLGEKVELQRWTAVLFGFVGVLVIANPTGEFFNYGTLMVLGCSVIDGYILLKGRFFSRTMPIGVIVIYYSAFATLGSLMVLPFVWLTPSFHDLALFILMGILGGVGQLVLTQAFKTAQASVIAPIGYTSIIWSVIFGYILWGDVPSLSTLIGGGIIILAGIYIVRTEHAKKSELIVPLKEAISVQKVKKVKKA